MKRSLVAILVFLISLSVQAATDGGLPLSTNAKATPLDDCADLSDFLSERKMDESTVFGKKAKPGDTAANGLTTGISRITFPSRRWSIANGKTCSGLAESKGALANCGVCMYSNLGPVKSKFNVTFEGPKDVETIVADQTGKIEFYFKGADQVDYRFKCASKKLLEAALPMDVVCSSLKEMEIKWEIPEQKIRKVESNGPGAGSRQPVVQ